MSSGARKVLMGVVVVGLFLGSKLYNKTKTQKEVQELLIFGCDREVACQEAVTNHFEACFKESFRMGGRRTSSKLDYDKLVTCINGKGGADYFLSETS